MKRTTIIAFVCLVFCALGFRGFTQGQSYDLLITGGRVLDGTGNPWFPADVAVKHGKIAAIGKLSIPMWALVDEGVDAGGQLGQLQSGGGDAFKRMRENFARRLGDPATREKIRRDIAHEIDRRGGADKIVVFEFSDASLNEKSLAEIAKTRKEDPIDTAVWIQLNGLNRPGGAGCAGFRSRNTTSSI